MNRIPTVSIISLFLFTMTKKEKAHYVLTELDKIYPETPIPLDHTDAYTLLIAVLLSAQCTDERVNKITPLLFAKASNPTDMIQLSIEEIQALFVRVDSRRKRLSRFGPCPI